MNAGVDLDLHSGGTGKIDTGGIVRRMNTQINK